MNANSRKWKINNHIRLILIYILSHGLLCLISGQWWDDWCYMVDGFAHLKEDYFESGIPLQAYNVMSVKWIPNGGYRFVVFFLFLLVGLLFYEIMRKLKFLSEEDAFYIAAIAMTAPVNDARTVLNCFGYTLELTLFMIGFLLAIKMDSGSGKKKIALRIVSLFCLFYSYTMESLLVFTGLIWIYLLYNSWSNNKGKNLLMKLFSFVRHYWDYIILPFVFFIIKNLFFKPHGRYAGYNDITPGSLVTGTLQSPLYAFRTGKSIAKSYILQIGVISLIVCVLVAAVYLLMYIKSVKQKRTDNPWKMGAKRNLLLFVIGLFVYFVGVYAYIIIRGGVLGNTGVGGRDTILAGFGIGIIAVAILRLIPIKRGLQNVLLIAVIILGIFHFNNWYLNYQEDWYYQQELANIMEENGGFEEDNTILCDFQTDSPIGGTRFYTINGLSYTVTGKTDKFFYAKIEDLQFGLVEDSIPYGGYYCDDYDSTDMSVDGVLFMYNAPIKNTELIKLRFYEMFDTAKYEETLRELTSYKYIRVSKAMSDRIYETFREGKLTQDVLNQILAEGN